MTTSENSKLEPALQRHQHVSRCKCNFHMVSLQTGTVILVNIKFGLTVI